jgi:hypothetical protein
MGSDEWKQWAKWLQEGHFISYWIEGIMYFEQVKFRDLLHYEYEWGTIAAESESGPVTPEELIVTRGYDSKAKINYIWQLIFGIKGQVYIYVELPGDTHRHGLPKIPKPSADYRKVSHFEEHMSPYLEPSFLTEHFMMKAGGIDRITLSAYNPNSIAIEPWLNFYIAALETDRVGTFDGKLLRPASDRWEEALTKLYKGTIPCRPLTLKAVRAPPSE